jgi:predicted RecA/RadA family phage recombinase
MKNYVAEGNSLQLTMPYAVSAGGGVKVGLLFGIAANTYANGEEGIVGLDGVYDVAKDSSVFAQGAAVYWDNTAKLMTSTTTSNTKIGVATVAAVTGDATVRVILNEAW